MWRAIVFMACGLFVLISISACITVSLEETYPENFSQIVKKSGECADISGRYEFSTLFADILEIQYWPYYNETTFSSIVVSTIEIYSDENSIEVVVNFDDEEILKSLSEESGDYQCYGDGIMLYEKDNIYYDLLGSSKELKIFYPAVDGALFYFAGTWAAGLVLPPIPLPPIPYFEQEGVWHRLEPVGKEQID